MNDLRPRKDQKGRPASTQAILTFLVCGVGSFFGLIRVVDPLL